MNNSDNRSLAIYATFSKSSKGRMKNENETDVRTCFQRDRDRILHSSAFRRLKHKTQVFLNEQGDYYRTRLTHTLEVSQISRSIAFALNLNEDLTEAIALSHDLGHPPFGHAGEEILNSKMLDFGGFDHNEQALRIICDLEKRYHNFNGLNSISRIRNGKIYRYYYGDSKKIKTAKKQLRKAKGKGFKSAFIVAFLNGEIISLNEAKKIE